MNEKLLEQLAVKLGTTTEYLWRVIVSGQFVNGIIHSAEALVWAVLLIGSLKWLRSAWRDDDMDEDGKIAFCYRPVKRSVR